jgi:CRP/FNR family transcriptional regulator, nitrogen fixation regulation protein
MLMRTALHQTATSPAAARPRTGVSPGPHYASGSLELMGAPMPYARNVEIYGEHEPTEYLYKVISGGVRIYRVLTDGRRQISAFLLPGDTFGLEAGESHSCSAEAMADSVVLVTKRSAVLSLAQRDPQVARELWTLTARALGRVQNHMLALVKTAQERIAAFLLEMAERKPGAFVELPMSRQDIADYLGLTIETVSRTLTQLEQKAAIAVPSSRRIVLRNRAMLAQLNA